MTKKVRRGRRSHPAATRRYRYAPLAASEFGFNILEVKCPFVPQHEMVKNLHGTDAGPLAHKGDWEKRPSHG